MPYKLRDLSGDQLIKFFSRLGFVLHTVNGSHIRIKRRTLKGVESLTIPRHDSIPKGTLKGIYNQAKPFVGYKVLDDFFYTK